MTFPFFVQKKRKNKSLIAIDDGIKRRMLVTKRKTAGIMKCCNKTVEHCSNESLIQLFKVFCFVREVAVISTDKRGLCIMLMPKHCSFASVTQYDSDTCFLFNKKTKTLNGFNK